MLYTYVKWTPFLGKNLFITANWNSYETVNCVHPLSISYQIKMIKINPTCFHGYISVKSVNMSTLDTNQGN